MKRVVPIYSAAVLTFSIALTSAAQSAGGRDAIAGKIKADETRWNQEWEAKSADKILAHYADDAILISPGAPAAQGKEAIRSLLNQMLADPALSLRFQAQNVAVSRSGDMAYTEGSYTLSATDPSTKKPINDKGSYVTVYKKQPDGSWKAVADIASSESPLGGSSSR